MTIKKAGVATTLFLSSVLAGLSIGCGAGSGTVGGSTGGGGSTPPPTVTVTSVSVIANPTSIIVGGTVQCIAVVNGANNPTQVVNWTATGGTINASGLFTSTTVGNGSCTATSTQAGYTTVSGSAAITVLAPLPTVTISASPTTVSAGNSSTLTINASNATQCTIPGIAATSCNLVETVTPTVTTTYVVTATGPGGSANASVTVTVTPAVPAISVNCVPSAITTADSAQCTATYQNLSSGVAWSVVGTGSAISASGVFTSSAAGMFTVTATSTQTGHTNVSGSTTITVTTAIPVITSMSLPLAWYCDTGCGISTFHIFGSGFASGDTISSTPNTGAQLASVDSSKQLTVGIGIGTGYPTGKQTFTVCAPDGIHCSSIAVALIGNQNTIAVGPDGEVYSYDQVDRIVWKYKPDGTADGSIFSGGLQDGMATDDQTTGDVLISQNSGNTSLVVGQITSIGNGDIGMGVSARKGVGCITQPVNTGYLSCVNIPQINLSNPTFNSVKVGSQPWSLWIGLFGTETDAYPYTRDGSPTLWKCNTFGGNSTPSCGLSVVLPGVTPVANLPALQGGWPVTGFDVGPAAGTVVHVSTFDKQLLRATAGTLQLIGSAITLPAVSSRAVADETNGNIIVASVDTTRMVTTFTKVNAATGVSTPLTSIANFVLSGLGISSDGTKLYVNQGNTFVVLPNN